MMKTDVLIIGAGGAGLCAALAAKDAGVDVKVITKEYATRSQTCMAQGGMNAALGNVSEDSIEAHIQNTLKSAHGEANEEAVRYMCSEAPNAVKWLDSIGVCFSRSEDGKIAQRALGGASAPRACYAQDYTGLKILHTLYDRCLQKDIEILNERYLLDLLKKRRWKYLWGIDFKSTFGRDRALFCKKCYLSDRRLLTHLR
jgi:succinate dehydrogenase / fumarate reductase flavoprotein subunit